MYDDIIQKQEKRGFIEKVSDPDSSSGSTHYIPHHAVKKESSTTPIRIVYDCSCRQTSTSPSLNDCLEVGPPFLNDMGSMLLRLRNHSIGLSTDIEKAFLYVQLHEDDRDMTRFLWLSDSGDPESEFQVYRFKSVLFGSTSSPFMLNAVLQTHLDKYDSRTTTDMKKNLYVDNIISGCEDEDEALAYYKESRRVLGDAKFNLRSWASNSKELQQRATEDGVIEPNIERVKILGLLWDTTTDFLKLSPQKERPSLSDNTLTTKREVLRESSKIYDPLGITTPVSMNAKILIQELWQINLDWDEPLDEPTKTRWLRIADDIREATKISIPRRYFTVHLNETAQLHIFSDASPKAYGAVAYITQGTESSFVMAKGRVAPLKKLSLPRLELMAALVGATLAEFLRNALKEKMSNPQVNLWSDSQIVLHWINSTKQLQQFVQNRIKEIHRLVEEASWRYCPTSDNPADLLTRGVSTAQLKESHIWLHGPTWLTDSSNWPTWEASTALLIEVPGASSTEKQEDTPVNEVHPDETPESSPKLSTIADIRRHSRLGKLLRVTGYISRFIYNTRNPQAKRTGPLSASELATAEKMWIKDRQSTYYREVIESLTKSKTRHTLVRQLRLFIDDDGLLRCGGRLHNAPITNETKFPILLPKTDYFTHLVIWDTHTRHLHAGINQTITALRQKFWIPTGRYQVKKTINKCVACKKVNGHPFSAPDSPPLPISRLQISRPFKVTGVDFTGALYVIEG